MPKNLGTALLPPHLYKIQKNSSFFSGYLPFVILIGLFFLCLGWRRGKGGWNGYASGVNDSWLIQGIHAGVPFMIIRMKIRVLHVKVLDLSLRWNQISTLITTGCSHYVIKMGNIILVATPSSPTCCSFTSCWLPGRAIWWWAGRLSLTETSSRKLANIGHIQEPPLQRSVADAYYARG